ncbi:hypothetical protein Pmani_003795 [Petrolisthes manimaculis]|uniref:HTH CENPB-type domain-containing protein n=1 Tax=Petrolisthes manimaculis TaxID=1843537 RepID=A0AAE1UM53_9EUCA|nr:hypothetical protein Pmani_003795 [Petrolisthes manimaculis]
MTSQRLRRFFLRPIASLPLSHPFFCHTSCIRKLAVPCETLRNPVNMPPPNPRTRKNKAITLKVKLEVIKRKEDGQGNSDIGRNMNLGESTVRCIWKKKDEIRKAVKAYGGGSVDDRKRVNDRRVVKMEQYLASWISDRESQSIPLTKKGIMDMARDFYLAICHAQRAKPGKFKASTGWLYRFLSRKDIRHINLTGEIASADSVAATNFPAILKDIIEEGGYVPEVIYNMDECGLQYKKMPKSTFLSKSVKQAKGRKIDKSRFTVLFCCNLAGTHKHKPLVVHTAAHPRCYNHLSDMSHAPVHWLKTANGWMNSIATQDWLKHMFIPEAKWHCKKLETGEDILRIYADATESDMEDDIDAMEPAQPALPAQPESAESDADDPPSLPAPPPPQATPGPATPAPGLASHPAHLLQPNPDVMTVKEFWRCFTIKDAVDNMLESWKEISVATIQRSWEKLTPHLVEDRHTQGAQMLEDAVNLAVEAARQVPGFGAVTREEIEDINRQGDEQTPENIAQTVDIEAALRAEAAATPQEAMQVDNDYKMSDLSAVLALGEALKTKVMEIETTQLRRIDWSNNFESLMRFYNESYQQGLNARAQSLITRYLRPHPQPAEPQPAEPQPAELQPAEPQPAELQPAEPQPGTSDEPQPGTSGYVYHKMRIRNMRAGPSTIDSHIVGPYCTKKVNALW